MGLVPVLRPYQEEDALWLVESPRAFLACDCGLGKTATVLASLTEDRLPALVVAPAQVARYSWPEELRLWRPDLSHQVLGSTTEPRDADVYVVSYSVLHKVHLPLARVNTLVLDESQYVKTWSATRSKAALAISRKVPNVVLLSGTPVGNSLADIHHQAKILDGGQRLGKGLGAFRNSFMTVEKRDPRTGQVWKWGEKPGARDTVLERLSDVMRVRRLDDYLSLPERVDISQPARLGRSESRVYRDLEREAVATLTDGVDLAAFSAAAVSTKLRQVCAGLVLDESGQAHEVSRAKRDLVRSLASQVCGPDYDAGQCVIWTQFRAEQAALARVIPDCATKDTLGYWLAGERAVLLAHPASLGSGVNLQTGGCHHEIWASPTWSLDQWVQSRARLHRGGQEHRVVSYQVQATLSDGKPTVDQAVYSALQHKGDLLEALRVALAA